MYLKLKPSERLPLPLYFFGGCSTLSTLRQHGDHFPVIPNSVKAMFICLIAIYIQIKHQVVGISKGNNLIWHKQSDMLRQNTSV